MTYITFNYEKQKQVNEIISVENIKDIRIEYKLELDLTQDQIDKLKILEVGILTPQP